MVKHTQTIRQLLPANCLSLFDHFVGLAFKGLNDVTHVYGNMVSIWYGYSSQNWSILDKKL